MNQIKLIEDDIESIPAMVYHERDAIKGIMAKDLHPQKLRNIIKTSVIKAFLSLGKSASDKDMAFIVDGLKAEILRKFGAIRDNEIQLALHKGMVGEYTPAEKIFTLSLSNFVEFIRSYMNADVRLLAFKELNSSGAQFLLSAKTQPSEHEIKQGKIKTAIEKFEQFKLTEKFTDWGNYIFDALVEFGVITEIPEKKRVEAFRLGKSILKSRYTRLTNSIDERHENKRRLEEMQKTPFKHAPLYVEVKKLLIKSIFKDWVDTQVELKELLKNV